MDLVDEVEVFRVAGDELTHDRADDGDLLPALADLVQHASDELRGYPIVAVGGVDPGRQQHDTAAHEPVRELGDRVGAEGGDPSAVLRIVDDIELPAGLHLAETFLSRAAMSAALFSSRVAASASRLIVIVTLSVGEAQRWV